MLWWPWLQRPRKHRLCGSAGAPRRSREVWADLVLPSDLVGARVAESSTRRLASAALETALNEPTVIVECVVRIPPYVVTAQAEGWREVRHG